MCAEESNRNNRIGNPLFSLRAFVGESSTGDVVYTPLRWNQELCPNKSYGLSTTNSERFGVPVYEVCSAFLCVLEAFFIQTAYGLTEDRQTLDIEDRLGTIQAGNFL